MPDIHVGFEEDDEWESRPNQRDDYRTTEDDGVTGTDPHDVVTVSATPTGQVTTVRIADQWRDKIGPDELGPGVVAAANAATMAALVRQVEAIVACCTVVGTPAGIVALVTFGGACVTTIGAEITALVNLANAANTTNTTIAQTLNDNTNFPNGNWPVSTSNMTDDHGGWQVVS